MSGITVASGRCFGCGRLFSFHPEKVPSIVIEGARRPICRNCVEAANPQRVAIGREPIKIVPGAYEPFDISELDDE